MTDERVYPLTLAEVEDILTEVETKTSEGNTTIEEAKRYLHDLRDSPRPARRGMYKMKMIQMIGVIVKQCATRDITVQYVDFDPAMFKDFATDMVQSFDAFLVDEAKPFMGTVFNDIPSLDTEENSLRLVDVNDKPEVDEVTEVEDTDLGRFGHHPDPAIDYCIECEEIHALFADFEISRHPNNVLDFLVFGKAMSRAARALDFTVGGDPACVDAKENIRRVHDKYFVRMCRDDRQVQVGNWVMRSFGEENQINSDERFLRWFEEVVEAGQVQMHSSVKHLNSNGHRMQSPSTLTRERLIDIIDHVLSKPIGDLPQELGGAGVTMLAYAQSVGVSADKEEEKEIARILLMDPEVLKQRHQAKADAGIAMPVVQDA